ncbi:hypothetical protein BGZ61DRAFT_491554 [Ilyonectria robusta]|uniref:uncharacterized protein n=1 Tax=Ilyonectria robusta TaxID=1079257 RepID=UPI001E8EC6FC|nr:uncharacterized protein BGZ61DRAFT_491554 [Ilyonectria robusta]KAH8734131.1 hypothetical protein BGZ61DRAFT_491554 [Ilyonectria robusta]
MDSSEEQTPSPPRVNGMSMVVVMGVTGSGKSYLINKLAGREVVKEGADLEACTQECQMIPVDLGNTKLKGIIYVHRITDIRYYGSAVKTFEIFKRICGETALPNVLLTTTRWHEVDEPTEASRERQLRDDFWAYMVGRGSLMSRFHGDRTSAVALISQLVIKEPIVLRLQHEMINEGKKLDETEAGSYVSDGLGEIRKQYLQQLESLEEMRQNLQEQDRAMRRRLKLDFERGREQLLETEKQQVSLRADVAAEVKEQIQTEAKRKTSGLRRVI